MEGIILLVEDERSLLSSLKTELQFENYQVLEAKDGLQAVEVFNDYSSEIDLRNYQLELHQYLKGQNLQNRGK